MHLIFRILKKILFLAEQAIDVYKSERREWKSVVVKKNLQTPTEKILIYVVHIHGSLVPQFLINNVNYWKGKGFSPILIVTYSNVEESILINKLDQIFTDATYLLRLNVGKDFGGIGDAVRELELDKSDVLILMNDSFIGPFYESNLYEKLMTVDSDVIGVTESFDLAYHLQSSFLYFKNKQAIKNFIDFFKNEYKLYEVRQNIILKGEIGLTQYLLRKGLKLRAIYPLQTLCAKYGVNFAETKFHKINSQHMYAEQMFIGEGFPYLKREALTKNQTDLNINFESILGKMDANSKDELNEALISRI